MSKTLPGNYLKRIPKGILYFCLFIAGILILLLFSLFQHKQIPDGEYHYSSLFRNGYTIPAIIIFFIVGLCIGYFTQLNPFVTSISLILIMPLVSITEGIFYRGSHNLIPFEFVIHFIMGVPAIAGAYIGRFILKKVNKRRINNRNL